MELQDVIRKKGKNGLKSVVMTIRTTSDISEWMKKNNVMPSKVFHKAVEMLMK